MQLDLDLAACFLVLAEERHYGRAAARLHLTSPALTKRIQRLERQLGVVVIERGTPGALHITAAGRRFAAAAGPLLAQAAAARDAARRAPPPSLVRIGVPAGTGNFLARIGLPELVRRVRQHSPETQFVCRDVPFQSWADCLQTGAVDVLWTSAPVRHAQVESVLLTVGSPIIGVVPAVHPWAEAGAVTAAAFCEEPMLFNPALPSEWMDPFWLADIRPRTEARLVEFSATDQLTVLRRAARGGAVIATPALMRPMLGPRLRAVSLEGSARLRFYAARRRTDNRDAVLALVAAFQGVALDAFATSSPQPR